MAPFGAPPNQSGTYVAPPPLFMPQQVPQGPQPTALPSYYVASNANNGRTANMTGNSNSDPALQARMEALRIQQRLLGDNHLDVIFALSSLAKLHQKRGDYQEASSILRESQRLQMRSYLDRPSKMNQDQSNYPSGSPMRCVPTEISFSRESS